MFVHFSEIAEPGYESLEEDAAVEFDVVMGPKGAQAHKVRLVHRRIEGANALQFSNPLVVCAKSKTVWHWAKACVGIFGGYYLPLEEWHGQGSRLDALRLAQKTKASAVGSWNAGSSKIFRRVLPGAFLDLTHGGVALGSGDRVFAG